MCGTGHVLMVKVTNWHSIFVKHSVSDEWQTKSLEIDQYIIIQLHISSVPIDPSFALGQFPHARKQQFPAS